VSALLQVIAEVSGDVGIVFDHQDAHAVFLKLFCGSGPQQL